MRFAHLFDHALHLGGLVGAKRGGGFVEDHDLLAPGDGAADGDGLLLAAGEVRDRPREVLHRLDIELIEHLAGLGAHRLLIDEDAPFPGRAPEEQVVGRRHVGDQREVLIDDLDATLAHPADAVVVQVDGLSLDPDLARIRRVDTDDGLDQRRFPSAVGTDHGDHLAPVQLERARAQRLYAAKGFRDVLDIQKRGCVIGHGQAPFPLGQRPSPATCTGPIASSRGVVR